VNDKDAQLEWESRWAVPAALAAFVAAIAFIGQQVLVQGALEDRPRVEALPDFLLSVDEKPGFILGSAAVYAVGALLLIVVFYYLFQAVLNREAAIPRWFIYLIFIGPVLFALAQVLGALDRIDLARDFVDSGVIRGEAGDRRADRFIEDNPNVPVFALSFAGLLGVAFLFVMLPLRARRVGLLSPFMGILGVVAGALLVLQLAPQIATIIVAFWLGALGTLFLGRWPGGRGPAWESGRSVPWPSAAERRGLARPGKAERDEPESAAAAESAAPEEPEPEAQRPASRKRKRKRG
jgi:hypothetical protein